MTNRQAEPTAAAAVASDARDDAKSPTLWARADAVLDKFRPTLNMDGGDVVLLDIQDGVAYVEMRGACVDCQLSQLTMKIGIRRIMRQDIPEISDVKATFIN